MNTSSAVRVALLGPSSERYKGGIAQFTCRLADEFGRSCDFRFFSWSQMYPSFLVSRDFRDTVSQTSTSSSSAEFILSFMNPLSWWRFVRALKRFAPDLIIFTWSHPVHAPVYLVIQTLLGTTHRVRLVCHNVLPHERFPGAETLTRWCFERSQGLIVHGASEESSVQALFGSGIDVQRLFLPLHDFFGDRLPKSTSGRDLLFFGNIRAYKGLDILLHAMVTVRQTYPDVRLKVAGEMFYPDDVHKDDDQANPFPLVERLGLEEVVTLDIRYIPNEEVPGLMAGADACVFPFRSATQSGAVTVAYSYGVPVVTTRVGGIPDVVVEGESGLLAQPEDVADLARALIQMLREPISPSAVDEFAARLSWSQYVSSVLAHESGN
jgi:glycosyltransferase involved in cell wall biosynthesis